MKLSCGLSKSVGGGGDGRTASVSVEVELDSVAFRRPEKLKAHIRCAFDRVREAIEDGLGRPAARATSGVAAETGDGDRTRPSWNVPRPATENRLRVLKAVAGRSETDLRDLVRQRLGKDAGSLSLSEASGLIDALGAANGGPR